MKKKKSLSDVVLLSLEKTVDGYVRFEDFVNNSHIYARGYDRPLKKSALSKSIKNLREKGLITTEKAQGRMILKMTNKGKNEVLIQKALRDTNWDGKWRIVIFDIPEENRKIRNILRARLKLWEFEIWQQSVWATKRDITIPLRDFIEEIGIEKWVKVIVTSGD